MILRSQVAGCGAYLPERVITNRELAGRLDTSDEWIRQRTGIGERRVAAPGELTSDLAVRAADRALSSAGMGGSDLDLLVLATATPDNTFPATAAKVQARLGMRRGGALDVQAGGRAVRGSYSRSRSPTTPFASARRELPSSSERRRSLASSTGRTAAPASF